MTPEEITEHTRDDPNVSTDEKGFTINFVKADDKANIFSGIRSQVDRLLKHTDVDVHRVQVYFEDSKSYEKMKPEDFTGDGEVVSVYGSVPIESLKLRSSPRNNRSYADIISKQESFNMGEE